MQLWVRVCPLSSAENQFTQPMNTVNQHVEVRHHMERLNSSEEQQLSTELIASLLSIDEKQESVPEFHGTLNKSTFDSIYLSLNV